MIAVVGYASVDRALRLDRLPAPGVTARVLADLGGGGDRPGGIAHAAHALAAGVDDVVAPVCAVGSDDAGRAFVDAMVATGCRVDGIVVAGSRTPTTELLYDPHGAAACVFDPGVQWTSLTGSQCRLVAAADVVVVMIGPATVTREVLARAVPVVTVAWVVKNDPAALLPEIADALRGRADIIFCNAAEYAFVEDVPPTSAAIVVRTDGPRPVTVTTKQAVHSFPVTPVTTVGNPTGAGDAFAGGFLAAWLRSADEARCVAAGAAAARLRVEGAPT